jgi:hypothetical protein
VTSHLGVMVLTKWDVTCEVVLTPGVCFAVMFHPMTQGLCRVREHMLYSIKGAYCFKS